MTGETLVAGVLGYLAAAVSFWMAGQGRREQWADMEARCDAMATLLGSVAAELEDRNLAIVGRGPDGVPREINLCSPDPSASSSHGVSMSDEELL